MEKIRFSPTASLIFIIIVDLKPEENIQEREAKDTISKGLEGTADLSRRKIFRFG